VMQIGRGRQRLDGFIGKMVCQDSAQAAGKLFAFHGARFARDATCGELQLRVPGLAEAAELKHNALAGFFRDAEHPANQGLLRAPQVQEGRVSLGAHFPWHAFQACQLFSISSNFGRTGGAKSVEDPSQFAGQLHSRA